MTVRRIEDESLWDDFVSASPQGTVFSKSQWIKTAASAQGGLPRFLGVFDDDRLAAGLTFVELSKGPFRKLTTPVLTPYGGVVYRPGAGKRESERESFNTACAEELISHLRGRYSHAFFVHSPGLADIRPFTWAGWQESVRYTYVLDLSDPERIWELLEHRVRKVLRKAESTLELGGPINIEQFCGLYERIYIDREKRPPIGSSTIKAFLKSALESGLAEMRTVRGRDGKVLSAMVFVYGDSMVFAWLSGSIPGKNSTGASSLLLWDAVRRYSGKYGSLDMLGANIPSIAFFKKGFGGKLLPYYVTERYGSWFARFALGVYAGLRKELPL